MKGLRLSMEEGEGGGFLYTRNVKGRCMSTFVNESNSTVR
jgi:hypothetical protein